MPATPQPTGYAETHSSRFARPPAKGQAVGSHFGPSPVLPVQSPLLKQSQLLAGPPLSDMLKFGGSFHVPQVTNGSSGGLRPPTLVSHTATQGGIACGPPLTARLVVLCGALFRALPSDSTANTHQWVSHTALLSPWHRIQQMWLGTDRPPTRGNPPPPHSVYTALLPPQWCCDPLSHPQQLHNGSLTPQGSGCAHSIESPSGSQPGSEHALVTLRHRQLGAEYPLAGQLR